MHYAVCNLGVNTDLERNGTVCVCRRSVQDQNVHFLDQVTVLAQWNIQ